MTLSRLAAGLVVWLGLQGAAAAISVETVNLQRMVVMADRVFYGRCLAAVEEMDSTVGLPVMRYRFQVLEGLKGVAAGDVVEFRQLSGSSRQMAIPGMPGFRKGQVVLVFLHPDSRLGLTSPVGLMQGIFRPEELEDGRVHFRNSLDNRNLEVGLDYRTPEAAALRVQDRAVLRGDEPLTLEILRRVVPIFDSFARREVQ
ncbi:MAG: hypothetical protein Kow001_10620 [Acidobacteriota bacterium]